MSLNNNKSKEKTAKRKRTKKWLFVTGFGEVYSTQSTEIEGRTR